MLAAKKLTLFVVLCLLAIPRACLGQTPQVLFITAADAPGGEWPTVRDLCDLYGLTCDRRSPEQVATEAGSSTAEKQTTLAAIVAASVLERGASQSRAAALWQSLGAAHIPVLIISTRPVMLSVPDPNGSNALADVRFVHLEKKLSSWRTTPANRDVMRELTAVSATVRHNTQSHVVAIGSAGPGHRIMPLMLIQPADGASYPVYCEIKGMDGPVFCAGFSHPVQEGEFVFDPEKDGNLISVIPILTFLRFAGGPYCWHRDADYANLTIDDPWLTEPYGFLSYQGLLAQMQKAHFHTTIAFIPWNYDRSSDKVVAIFREHPEYYSLCVHGNNHDHWEFYKYHTIAVDPLPARPLPVQEANIRQGLARMEKFRQLTGLDFDQVMVFPQYIAPLETFNLLKKYNFLITSNATNIPLDLEPPPDPVFHLTSITDYYENFASIMRYSPGDRPQAAIALDLFLDNPVLFFEHHSLFRRGMSAFNKTAEMVNTLQPDTKWTGLGNVARHSHLQRSRPDGNRDVRAFCRSIDLVNDEQRGLTCFVEKAETSSVPIRRVLVNGAPHAYDISSGQLRLAVELAPHQSCRIDIEYEDQFQAAQVDIARNDAHLNRIRALSDFRDCTLMRNAVTRSVVGFYYGSMLYRLGPMGAAAVCGIVALMGAVGARKLRKWAGQRTSQVKIQPTSHGAGVIHAKPELERTANRP